jgi:hypothetical protein
MTFSFHLSTGLWLSLLAWEQPPRERKGRTTVDSSDVAQAAELTRDAEASARRSVRGRAARRRGERPASERKLLGRAAFLLSHDDLAFGQRHFKLHLYLLTLIRMGNAQFGAKLFDVLFDPHRLASFGS